MVDNNFAEITKPLVISMGFNGYQWKWRRAVASHKTYCHKQDYDYVFVQRPAFSALDRECAWLKLMLIISALWAGRTTVLFIDCDAVISNSCPALDTVTEDDKSLYLAKGFSGRVNSGVILVHRSKEVVSLFARMITNALRPVPPEDDVGWGENGHIIHYSKNFPGLKILGTEWNNNQNPALVDYIGHYSAGPMREHFHFTFSEKVFGKIGNRIAQAMKKLSGEQNEDEFLKRLERLMEFVSLRYTQFSKLEMQRIHRAAQ